VQEVNMSLIKVVGAVARGLGYLVVGAVLLGVVAATLGGFAAIVAAYVIP
jgi:hypothetical protein